MLNTGIRAGEAVALKYSDIDLNEKTVNIENNIVNVKKRDNEGHAFGRIIKEQSPKTKNSQNKIPLNDKSIRIINDLKSREIDSYQEYIIHNKDFKPIDTRSLTKRFYNILKVAKIDRCGLHTLRHTFGTILYSETNNLKLVNMVLRHSDIAFTANTYIHQDKIDNSEVLKNFSI